MRVMTPTSQTCITLPSSVVKTIGRGISTGLTSWTERVVDLSRSKISYNLLDRLCLLSPRTWYGILLSQTQSGFHAFDGRILATSFAAAVIPLLFLAHFYYQHGSIRQREFLWRAVTPISLLSPWNLAAVSDFTRQCRILATALSNYWYGRVDALPSALLAREDFLLQGRLTTHRRYEVYWPPPKIVETEEDSSDQHPEHSKLQEAILLLPGYGISHLAYSEVACRLANAGLVVVTASMEPLRIAHRHLGADSHSMTRIMKRVQNGNIFRWHLLGHSAGAFAAMHLYDKFHETIANVDRKDDDIILGKLILWGCTAMVDMATDLSHLGTTRKDGDPLSILLIQGTNDSVVELMKSKQEAFDRLFPSGLTSTQWIQDGTHHGFASYSPAWPGSPSTKSDIPIEYQQQQACEKTIWFLFQPEVALKTD